MWSNSPRFQSLLNGQMSSQPPTHLGLVHESHLDVEGALAPTVVDKIYCFSVHSRILLASLWRLRRRFVFNLVIGRSSFARMRFAL